MQKIPTTDGSFTLFSERFNEHYHSVHGAASESKVVYIDALNRYLNQTSKKEIAIFEMGFGSGLNALLACEFATEYNVLINYFSIEKFPVSPEILLQQKFSELYKQLIEADWNHRTFINPNFNLTKIETDILNFNFETIKSLDVVFYDAFSPDTQPELWTTELFTSIFNSLNAGGILATYSSKGIVKEALRNAGFTVKRLPGPAGKRHILNALKI